MEQHEHSFKRARISLSHVEDAPHTFSRMPRNSQVLLVLVGPPGSGKSTFADRLARAGGWTRICQDEIGHQQACVELSLQALRKGSSVVIDRCNFSVQQRAAWVQMARSFGESVVFTALCFWVPLEECIARVSRRQHHPTLPSHKAVDVVTWFCQQMVPPNPSEGFAQIHWAASEQELEEAAWAIQEQTRTPRAEAPQWTAGRGPPSSHSHHRGHMNSAGGAREDGHDGQEMSPAWVISAGSSHSTPWRGGYSHADPPPHAAACFPHQPSVAPSPHGVPLVGHQDTRYVTPGGLEQHEALQQEGFDLRGDQQPQCALQASNPHSIPSIPTFGQGQPGSPS
ncbi:hypothetical protein CYMTET_30943, partial [Cymbomonas tetramitiformis]